MNTNTVEEVIANVRFITDDILSYSPDGEIATLCHELRKYTDTLTTLTQHHQAELAEVYREILDFTNSGHFEPATDTGWSIDLGDVADFVKEKAQSRGIDISDKK